MSRPHPTGPLATYNSLRDKHLVGYFSNTRIRRHLQRSGLITRSGRILSEKEYKENIMRKDHYRFTREYLANAIFRKILEMEHNYQMELKRCLETTAQKERVQRAKVRRSRRAVEHYMPVLSPHPPIAAKANHGSCAMADQMNSSSLRLALPRPNTAPGRPSTAPANMQQRPNRLQPLLNHPAAGGTLKPSSAFKSKTSPSETEGRFPSGGERYKNPSELSHGVAPYQLPIINEYLMPVPPPLSPRNEKMTNKSRIEAWRRRVRPTTAPNIPDPHRDSGRYHKSPLHSNAFITMIYWGKSVHLNHDDINYKDEIKIYQQHCGGENLCVFQGKLLEKETFQFISKRHYGFPFSLTFFLNGMQLDRLSSCCEFKHRRGSRLGGKNGYFGFVNIDGASPCYKCIISMGLDKKPFPPPKREKGMMEVNEGPVKEEELTKPSENLSAVENVGPTPAACPTPEDEKNVEDCVEEGVGRDEETGPDPAENNQEASFKDDYDEDFEVDDEKSNEKVNEDGQTDDQMNGRSKSPSDDEKDNLDHEKESETSFQEIRETSNYMKYEIDGCSDDDPEDAKQARKTSSSGSSRSNIYSSSGEDMSEMGDGRAYSEQSQEETHQENSYFREMDEEDKVEEYLLSQGVMDGKEVESKRMDPEGICEDQETECHSSFKNTATKSASEWCRDQASGEGKEEDEDARLPLAKTAKEMPGTMARLSKADEGGDLKSIQEEIKESVEENEPSPSEMEPSDSSADEAQEGLSSLDRLHKDGDLLAEETMALEMEAEESKHDAPEGEQLKRREASEGEVVPQPKKTVPEAQAEEPRSRKEEEKEEEEEGEDEGKEEEEEGKEEGEEAQEEGEEEEEQGEEKEEKAEAALGRGWVEVNSPAPQALVKVAELTKVREVPGAHWDGEETGVQGERLASKEEGEAAERMRTALVITEEETWRDSGSERKKAGIQEEVTVEKATREGQRDTGEVRHEGKSEGRLEEIVIQNAIAKSKEEEAESEIEEEGGCTESVSPATEDMAAWREVSEMEDCAGTYQEGQEGGQKAAALRSVSPEGGEVKGGVDLEDVRGPRKEIAAVKEEIMTEEETEALNETLRETLSQREVMIPLDVAEAKEVFEQLEETTNGGEEKEEKACDTKEGELGQGMEPVERAVFLRESAENERKLSPEESASEVKGLLGKEGIPGMEEEMERQDRETRDRATREVTCRAKEENKVEKPEMELPEEVGRSDSKREGAHDVTLTRKEWTPEDETTTKEALVMGRVEALGEIGGRRAKEMGVLAKTHRAAFEEVPGMQEQVGEEVAPAPRTGTEMSLEKEAPENKIQDGKTILERRAEADLGDTGGMAATALEGELLADETGSEGKTEENKASSPSDVAAGETWLRQEQLLKKTALTGREAVEAGRGERVPAVEEVTEKAAPEAAPATQEGVLGTRLMIQASGWERDQRGGIVREDWMRENSQAEEAGYGQESRLRSPAPRGEARTREGGPQSQSPQALETMTVENESAEIREKQESTAPRKDGAPGTEAPRP
ncbi:glutamate-rich protein 3-like [Petaurus breviceps papuanus]|uniref:glutamate-rich protein 3-like n=1 Tax=Petaurus breviceps papuanus TaxID=3040969 RepID=UPI0036D9E0BD